MTACERASELFGRAWDDELTVAEREGLERHFTACTSCRREYDELARTLELVQALPRPQVDESFAPRVLAMARAREEEAAAASLGRRLFALPAAWTAPSFGRPAFALAATFVVALGIGAFVMSRPAGVPVNVATVPPARTEAPLEVAPAPVREVAVTAPAPKPVAKRVVPATALAAAAAPTIADSLFDHSADVELVLDPVQLRRERGRGYTPSSPAVRGEAASITF